MRIGVVGGTGREGKGLALRWARAGHQVAIGSRDGERGRERGEALAAEADVAITGGDNLTAVSDADVVVLTVPYTAHAGTLTALKDALQGRVLVDLTVPLRPPKVRRVHLPPGQAAALEAQQLLGDGVRVVAALHHVSSVELGDLERSLDSDVLVCSDDRAARDLIIELVGDLGARGLDAGPLVNAIALESLTPVLLHLNKRYKLRGAGLKISGPPRD